MSTMHQSLNTWYRGTERRGLVVSTVSERIQEVLVSNTVPDTDYFD
jgi:hypothetical protein